MNRIALIECPRDAMQGWKIFIPTEQKIAYINSLLQVGFDTIDFGSFVSPKMIPQMADTNEVIEKLDLTNTKTKLLAIIANIRGAEQAVAYKKISYLGFPFSISPTFQLRNTNSTIEESLKRIEEIQKLCIRNNKELIVYLSMGFGNPYGDAYDETILIRWAEAMVQRSVKTISLADTVGLATPQQIEFALKTLTPRFPETAFGVHLHSTHQNWQEKLAAAIDAGCSHIDGALKGIGGCPMAGNDLVGNMDTENIVNFLEERHLVGNLNKQALTNCLVLASRIFSR
jgi:hydroxymethylglutaryl-CoA lyase